MRRRRLVSRPSAHRFAPRLELLEDRVVPATFIADPTVADGAKFSLRWCVTQANKDKGPDNDVIVLKAGVYNLTLANTSGQENANARGDLDFTDRTDTVTLRGAGEGATIIRQTVTDRVIHLVSLPVSGSGAKVTLENLTIEDGSAVDDGFSGSQPGTGIASGGGILSRGGVLKLNRVTVQDCQALGSTPVTAGDPGQIASGGGIDIGGVFGSVTLTGVTIQNCDAIGGDGAAGAAGGTGGNGGEGGLARGGGLFIGGVPATLTSCRILNNIVDTGGGGDGGDGLAGDGGNAGRGGQGDGGGVAIDAFFGPPFSMTDCKLQGNQITGGGGGNGGDSVGGTGGAGGEGGTVSGAGLSLVMGGTNTYLIARSTFHQNTLNGGGGGGLGGTPGGLNGADGASRGAGASIQQAGIFTTPDLVRIHHSTFSNNVNLLGAGSVSEGGGLSVLRTGSATAAIDLTNVTIANNSAVNGGGLSVGSAVGNNGAVSLLNVTVSNNTATNGGGVRVFPSATTFGAINSLIAENTATIGPDVSGSFSFAQFNLLGDGSGAFGITDGVNNNQVGTTLTPIDPMLDPLGTNGGPTATMALQVGSPAIDAGDNGAVTGLAFDQRGDPFVRVADGTDPDTVDLGAFEFQPLPNAVNVRVAVGTDAGIAPTVRVFDGLGNEIYSFQPYATDDPDFLGGVRVALGDVDGDLTPEVIVAPGAGMTGGAKVKIYDGVDLFQGIETSTSFLPFGAYEGEVFVAAGNFTGTAAVEIVVGNASSTGGPRVRVFDGTTFVQYLTDLQPFGATYKGGVRVAVGDVDGDGQADLVAAQSSKGTLVRAYDGADLATLLTEIKAAGTAVAGGFFVATGDIDGDARADIIVGLGKGPVSKITVYEDASDLNTSATKLASGKPFGSKFKGGARVATVDYDLAIDGLDEIVAVGGSGNERRARYFKRNGAGLSFVDEFFAELAPYKKGLFVAAALMP